jgi:PAS domain S-box-containing protein
LAIIVSTWIAGLRGGVAATLLSLGFYSAVLINLPASTDPPAFNAIGAGSFTLIGLMISIAGSAQLATNRKAVDRGNALLESERRVSAILEVALDAIIAIDEDNIITGYNPAAEAMFGYSYDEAIGTSVADRIIPPQFHEAHNHGLAQHIATGHGPIIGKIREVTARKKDGTEFPVEIAITSIKSVTGTEFISHIRDISQRKRAEAEIALAAARNERIAETLQRSMLHASRRINLPGVKVETFYEAALDEATVGGDFFDAFPLDPETVALVVGDVSGKGLQAAARTAEARYALRGFLHEEHSPKGALRRLNDYVYRAHEFDIDELPSFIVLAVAVVNFSTGTAVFSAAGAEASLILRNDGSVEHVGITGTPIGVVHGSEFDEMTATLRNGDTLLMATDGITEARRGGDFLGIDGMADLAAKAGSDRPLPDLIHAVYTGAREFAGGELRDDVCVLAARRE